MVYIRHITLFRINPDVSEATRREALQLLQEVGKGQEGVLEWTAAESTDSRNGYVLVVNSLFVDAPAQQRFRASERHMAAGRVLGTIATWLNGDYEEEPS